MRHIGTLGIAFALVICFGGLVAIVRWYGEGLADLEAVSDADKRSARRTALGAAAFTGLSATLVAFGALFTWSLDAREARISQASMASASLPSILRGLSDTVPETRMAALVGLDGLVEVDAALFAQLLDEAVDSAMTKRGVECSEVLQRGSGRDAEVKLLIAVARERQMPARCSSSDTTRLPRYNGLRPLG
jgi:hypothetical protein